MNSGLRDSPDSLPTPDSAAAARGVPDLADYLFDIDYIHLNIDTESDPP